MQTRSTPLLLVLTLSIHTIIGFHEADQPNHFHTKHNDGCINITNSDNIYDSFITHWNPEACYHNDASNCNVTYTNTFNTVYGLWPHFYEQENGNWYPSTCVDQPLQQEDLALIEPLLNKYWPIFSQEHDNFWFWSQEWSKHGTCWSVAHANDQEAVSQKRYDPTEYFKAAVRYLMKYDIYKTLSEMDIVPSTNIEYDLIDVSNALHYKFTKRPVISCKGSIYIHQFRLCFDRNGKIIDCPNAIESNCGEKVILTERSIQGKNNDAEALQKNIAKELQSLSDKLQNNEITREEYDQQTQLLVTQLIRK